MSQRGRKAPEGGRREKRNRLLLASPMLELGYNRFWIRLLGVDGIGAYIDQGKFVPVMGHLVQEAHNGIIEMALERKDWDRLVWLEYDHVFPRDMLTKMLYHREPVVSGLYFGRVAPYEPIVYFWNEERDAIRHASPVETLKYLQDPGLYEVGAVPSGAVSIRRDVLEKWGEHYPDLPWYAAPVSKFGRQQGDDIWFCRHVADMGYKIHLDSSIRVKHMVVAEVDERFYLAELQRAMAAEQAAAAEANEPAEERTESGIILKRSKIETPQIDDHPKMQEAI